MQVILYAACKYCMLKTKNFFWCVYDLTYNWRHCDADKHTHAHFYSLLGFQTLVCCQSRC